jgi:hypothetical protein
MIGTLYGLSVCCVYTLAIQKINYSQNCCTNFSDRSYPLGVKFSDRPSIILPSVHPWG